MRVCSQCLSKNWHTSWVSIRKLSRQVPVRKSHCCRLFRLKIRKSHNCPRTMIRSRVNFNLRKKRTSKWKYSWHKLGKKYQRKWVSTSRIKGSGPRMKLYWSKSWLLHKCSSIYWSNRPNALKWRNSKWMKSAIM